ncbi:hypothetical protein IU433_26460, partial [Nocardia puris]
MSIRTRTVESPGRVARRVQAAERVKSGAAQRAYAKRKLRAEQRADTPRLPARTSVTAARIPFVAAMIAMLACGLALTLLLTTRAAEDSYQLSDARQLNRQLADERAALQQEVAAADSAPELAARARELGMIPAKDPARLVLGPDGTVTVIGDETPAQGAPVPPLNQTPRSGPATQPGHVLAEGERVIPVSTVRTPEGEHPAPAPNPASPVPAPNAASPVPEPNPASPVPAPDPANPAPAPDPANPNPAPAAEVPQPAPAPQPVAAPPADGPAAVP